MMKPIIRIVLFFVFITTSFSGKAEDTKSYYFGVGLSSTTFTADNSNLAVRFPALNANATVNPNSVNLALYAGYKFDNMLAFELDTIGAGSVTADNAGQQVKLYEVVLVTASAVFNKQLNDQFNLFAKLGGTSWQFIDANSSTVSGFGASFGAGMDINLYGGKEHLLRVDWMRTNFDNGILSSANILTISGLFSF